MSPLVICLIICVVTIALYVWDKLPMGAVAMLSMIAFLITGCITPEEALLNFGNNNAVMLLSMFVVAAGFNRTQFVHKCAMSVNNIARGSLTKVLFGYIVVTIILSQFIQSPLIVIGIMVPMLTASCEQLNISPSKVVFPLGIAAIATCSTLPLGSGATVFAELNGYLEANAYTIYSVGLLDPMKARLPLLIVCAIYCIFIAPKIAPDKPDIAINENVNTKRGGKEKAKLGPVQEWLGYIIFIATTLGLIFQRKIGQPAWLICLLGAVLMVVSGVLSEKEAFDAIPWWMGLLFVGSLSMGNALTNTGTGEVIGNYLASVINNLGNPYLIGLVFFLVPFILTQVMQNRTVMMIFITTSILACKSLGANPVGIIILVQAGCLTAFMTPMATPAVPMFMAEGGYDLKAVLKQSVVPAIIFCIVSVVWIMSVFPMF